MKPSKKQIELAKMYLKYHPNPYLIVDETGAGPIISTRDHCRVTASGARLHVGHDPNEPCPLEE